MGMKLDFLWVGKHFHYIFHVKALSKMERIFLFREKLQLWDVGN
jgi:hypothetical protein